MAEHDPMSPSKWSTWTVCPSYVPSEKSSAEADEGNSAHATLATLLKGGRAEGEILPQVEWAARTILDLANGMPLYVETKVAYDDGNIKYSGTPDVHFLNTDGELVVVDFKTFADGSFDHFPQLMGYALAIYSTVPALQYKPMHLIVLAGGVFKAIKTTVTSGECLNVAINIFNMVNTSNSRPPVANPHCKYCAKCTHCTAAIERIDDMNESNLTTITNTLPSLPDERIIELLDQCTVAEGIVKSMRNTLKSEVYRRNGVTHNGITYVIRAENGTATINSADDLFHFLTSNGVSTEAILKSVKLGLPAAAKLLRSVDFTIKNDKDARAKLTPFYTIPAVSKLHKIID